MISTQREVSLTGIKPTGEPHLGNYIGAIRPALELAEKYESIYFIADYHALTSVRDPQLLRHYTRSIAAGWLAAGLDPTRTIFYLDAGINMGLYCYPVLMAIDILIMETNVVPVGKDQVQHVEYAADIAGSFNHLYGTGYTFKIPHAVTPDTRTGETLPGLDGRKMSKSYGNTVPLFAPGLELKKLIRRVQTDATPVDAPKNPDSSAVFQIYEQFAAPENVSEMRRRLEAGGIGWGELKNALFEELDRQLAPLRERYDALMDPGSELDALLTDGAAKARERATPVLKAVRKAIGI